MNSLLHYRNKIPAHSLHVPLMSNQEPLLEKYHSKRINIFLIAQLGLATVCAVRDIIINIPVIL